MWRGKVEGIHVGREAARDLPAVTEIRAVPGRGLEGDRYFYGTGTYSRHPGSGREVTLIAPYNRLIGSALSRSLMSSSLKKNPAPMKKSRPLMMRVLSTSSWMGRLTTSSAPAVMSR